MSELKMEMKRENFDSSVQDPLQIPSEIDNIQKSEESKKADEILICEPKIEDIQENEEDVKEVYENVEEVYEDEEEVYDLDEYYPPKQKYKKKKKVYEDEEEVYDLDDYYPPKKKYKKKKKVPKEKPEPPLVKVTYDCQFCDAKLASKGSLFNHVKIVHEKARPFKCPICGRDFAAKQQMQQHVSSIHEGNRPFACEICHDVRFRGKQGLNEHMASVHEGVTYECTLCERSFKSKQGLKGHHTTVHDTANAFQCPFCSTTFAQKNGLKLHIAGIHEGIKPHACKICDYTTTQKSTLKQHIQQVHVEGKDAQLWKYDPTTEMMKNHKGKWNGRNEIKCYLPPEGSEGHIENDYCHVLGLEEGKIVSGTRAKFESTEYTTLTDHHMWLRGKADKNGYFTFQSRTSGLFLTAVNPFRTTIESRFKIRIIDSAPEENK